MKTQKVYKVVRVPFPIHPLHAFQYFLCTLRGEITHKTAVSYFWGRGSAVHAPTAHDPSILYIRGILPREIKKKIRRLFLNDGGGTKKQQEATLGKLLEFCSRLVYDLDIRKRRDVDALFRVMTSKESPWKILNVIARSFTFCLRNNIDPLLEDLPILVPAAMSRKKPLLHSLPGHKRVIQLGTQWKSFLPDASTWGGALATNPFSVVLSEKRLTCLADEQFVVLVGGSKNMDKTTFVANLFRALCDMRRELLQQSDWRDFSLKILPCDMDFASPVLNAILFGIGRESHLVQPHKQQWTRDLAYEALSSLQERQNGSHIIIADLPGGPPDAITEITSAIGDTAIILENSKERFLEWKSFFQEIGVPISAIIPSGQKWSLLRDRQEIDPEHVMFGLARKHTPCRGFERLVRPDDPFVRAFAAVLLFGILPEIALERDVARRMYYHKTSH